MNEPKPFFRFTKSKITNFLIFLIIISVTGLIVSCNSPNTSSQIDSELNLPLPDYLPWVYPMPNSSLTLADFRTEDQDLRPISHAVCVEFHPSSLLTAEDNNKEFRDYVSNISLDLDGEMIDMRGLDFVRAELGVDRRLEFSEDSDEIKTLTSNAVGPYKLCWTVNKLSAGEHFLKFEYELTSGELVTYSWSFEITE